MTVAFQVTQTTDSDRTRPLCTKGPVLIVARDFPPRGAAAAVVLENLLRGLETDSYHVATAGGYGPLDKNASSILQKVSRYYRVNTFFQKTIGKHLALRRLLRLCEMLRPVAILGQYPDALFLDLAYRASKATHVPLYAYLHDTIAEGLEHTSERRAARRLQDQVFRKAKHIFVMSEGMRALYNEKYGVTSSVLQHSFPEYVGATGLSVASRPHVFFGGSIYSINQHAVTRTARAAQQVGLKLEVTSFAKALDVQRALRSSQVVESSYPAREDYLAALRKPEVLLLALDWPDESMVHKDELATIFSTKVIEYLASGRPILVHCPAHYFMATFLKERQCAHVVSSRDENVLAAELQRVRTDKTLARRLVENAQATLAYFQLEPIQDHLIEVLEQETR